MKRAVFIDRDGVINKIVKHPELVDKDGKMCADPLTPEELEFLPGVVDACKQLHELGLPIIIVTNQPGLAKGFFTQKQFDEIMAKLTHHLRPTAVYYCPHHPSYTGDCDCRKPKPGMLLKAAQEHAIDLTQSYMVGDKDVDLLAGAACKVRYFVGDPAAYAALPDHLKVNAVCVDSLLSAVAHIRKDANASFSTK
jgi:D-glycero-D-manno-heptose 1,7-bisphosphate phosphatase